MTVRLEPPTTGVVLHRAQGVVQIDLEFSGPELLQLLGRNQQGDLQEMGLESS